MELSFASLMPSPAAAGMRGFYGTKLSFPAPPIATTRLSTRKIFPWLALTEATHPTLDNELDLESSKHHLLTVIQDTQRGILTTAHQRFSIEEALVSVERYDAGAPIDLGKLDGTWRLQYTSAPDVLILLESSARFPFFQEQEGATLLVSAKFSIVSLRNIYLQFEEIAVQNINISEELQALIAPAILPRSFFSLQILQFIRSFKAQFPVRNPGRQRVGGLYYLSYLDGNMLLGRADGGGVFVFTKAQPLV